jgi:hypothetical protein
MAYSYRDYPGTGSQVDFGTPPYLSREHISVTVGGVPTLDFTWHNDATVRLASAPALNTPVRVQRRTSPSAPMVTFTNGAGLPESDLNTSALQAFYMAQETLDVAGQAGLFPMAGATSVNPGVAGTVPAPAAGDQNKYLRGNGTWSGVASNFIGATGSANGVNGYVPAPLAGQEDFLLRGDGTWVRRVNRFNTDWTTGWTINTSYTVANPLEAANFDQVLLQLNCLEADGVFQANDFVTPGDVSITKGDPDVGYTVIQRGPNFIVLIRRIALTTTSGVVELAPAKWRWRLKGIRF